MQFDSQGNYVPTKFDTELIITGMMCQNNCAKTVENALMGVPNVTRVLVSYEQERAHIWKSPTVNVSDLILAVEAVGFEAIPFDHQFPLPQSSDAPDCIVYIDNMHASDCLPIRETLLSVDGVLSLDVQSNNRQVLIWGFADVSSITTTLQSAGYAASELKPSDRGMSGPSCARSIEGAVRRVRSVHSIRVSQLLGKVEVGLCGSEGSTEEVRGVIAALGYAVSVGETRAAGAGPRSVFVLDISGMSCANCSTSVERAVRKLHGVVEVTVSSTTGKGRVVVDDDSLAVGARDLVETVCALGYGCRLVEDGEDLGGADEFGDLRAWGWTLVGAALLELPAMGLRMWAPVLPSLRPLLARSVACRGGLTLGQLLLLVLAVLMQFGVGFRYYRAAVLGLMHGRLGMDLLVVTGTTITFLYNLWELAAACVAHEPSEHAFSDSSGMLLTFVTLGKFIEAYAKGKAVSAISSLGKLQPRKALLVTSAPTSPSVGADAASALSFPQEQLQEVDIAMVQRGDVMKILPGSRIACDGVVLSGRSSVDESLVTGESVPVLRQPGDQVFGSTVNQESLLYVRVSHVGRDSALAQIVQLMHHAQMSKAPAQALADRVAAVFTPVVLLLAACTFVLWWLLIKYAVVPSAWMGSIQDYGSAQAFALQFAISVVVISCPCSLGLAVPTAILVGTSVAANCGVLIKGGVAFETAHRVNTIMFDKTGTLTEGRPCVTDTVLLDDDEGDDDGGLGSNTSQGIGSEAKRMRLLRLAASAEQGSDHPVARALLQAAEREHVQLLPLGTDAFTSCIGGVRCRCGEGTVIVGNRDCLAECRIAVSSPVERVMCDLEVQGKTAVCVVLDWGADWTVLGVLGIADKLKRDAHSAVSVLRSMRIDLWMVTGDNHTTAEAIGDELGFPRDRIVAGATPAEKAVRVEALQAEGRIVGFVGDGVNDSPALAGANIGIAIGAGTQVAMEAADVVLMRSSLMDVVVTVDLAQHVFTRIKWNLLWAVLYNVIAIPVAGGVCFPWTHKPMPPHMAGLCMAASSVSVILSSMALRWYRRPSLARRGGGSECGWSRLGILKGSLEHGARARSAFRGPQYSALPLEDEEDEEGTGLELGVGPLSVGRGLGLGSMGLRLPRSVGRPDEDEDDLDRLV